MSSTDVRKSCYYGGSRLTYNYVPRFFSSEFSAQYYLLYKVAVECRPDQDTLHRCYLFCVPRQIIKIIKNWFVFFERWSARIHKEGVQDKCGGTVVCRIGCIHATSSDQISISPPAHRWRLTFLYFVCNMYGYLLKYLLGKLHSGGGQLYISNHCLASPLESFFS